MKKGLDAIMNPVDALMSDQRIVTWELQLRSNHE